MQPELSIEQDRQAPSIYGHGGHDRCVNRAVSQLNPGAIATYNSDDRIPDAPTALTR